VTWDFLLVGLMFLLLGERPPWFALLTPKTHTGFDGFFAAPSAPRASPAHSTDWSGRTGCGEPPADASGEVMMVLDEKNANDAGFLRLISDPTATGSFLL
jgi:hypothetical protein